VTNFVLYRSADVLAWELRAAWASGKRVALSLERPDGVKRLEGHVRRVAPSGAFVVVGATHVPMDVVLAVHNPSRLGDSTISARGQWWGAPHRITQREGQLPLWEGADPVDP
jgi:hypothetical protein